jgi:hypothetical protein
MSLIFVCEVRGILQLGWRGTIYLDECTNDVVDSKKSSVAVRGRTALSTSSRRGKTKRAGISMPARIAL